MLWSGSGPETPVQTVSQSNKCALDSAVIAPWPFTKVQCLRLATSVSWDGGFLVGGGARATPQKTCPSSNCFTPNLPHLNVVSFVLRSPQNQALDPRPSPGGNMGSTPPGWSFWILPCGVRGYSVVMRDSLALALCQTPPSPGVKRDRGNNRA